MAYIGRSPEYGNAVSQQITGTNSVGPYTLSYDTSTSGVVVSLDGVVQRNSVDFNIVGTALTFTSTVGTGIIINVVFTGLTLSFPTPSDGSVTDAKIVDMAATKLTGTIADARFPATLPAISGANLTSLPSDITKSTSEPAATTNPSGGVGTVWLRTTTGEMYCLTDSTTNANVWTNIGDGTGVMPYVGMVATGGTITTDGDYKVHVFNSSGTFEITTLGHDAVLDYLVIAGGGAGGSYGNAGGGGAGGYLTATAFSVSATSYSITVGGGGPSTNYGAYSSSYSPGTDSIFSSITANGGGSGSSGNIAGQNGGSGGGGNGGYGTGGGTGSQGSNGGAASVAAYAGGGGGGSSSVGQQGSAPDGGDGGNGTASSITGSAVTRAGGGGGSAYTGGTPGAGGTGGGGSSGSTTGVSGTVNTGSGGGSGGLSNVGTSGAGGSGVVILRYKFQ